MTNPLIDAMNAMLDAEGIESGALVTPFPGLRVVRTYEPVPPRLMAYKPSLCVIAQGAKRVLVGDQAMTYGNMQTMVVTVDVPVFAEIFEASADRPYVSANLDLDTEVVLDVATRLHPSGCSQDRGGLGLKIEEADAELTGLILRLLASIGRPGAVEILYPAIMQEIAYWLLIGPAGPKVAQMVLADGQSLKIARAIQQLRANLDQPVNIADLARSVGMSASTFYHHFKSLTSMSPLQYQKRLRLLEARRRMVAGGETVGTAAFSVGYESVSQFSREYARMFGAPPRRETQRVRVGGRVTGVGDALDEHLVH